MIVEYTKEDDYGSMTRKYELVGLEFQDEMPCGDNANRTLRILLLFSQKISKLSMFSFSLELGLS